MSIRMLLIDEVCDDPIMTMYDKETNKEFLVA